MSITFFLCKWKGGREKMDNRIPIKRKSINYMKSIQREYCGCFPLVYILVNGVPNLIDISALNLSLVKDFLSRTTCVCPLRVNLTEHNEDVALYVLSMGIPIRINITTVLPSSTLLQELKKVPHSTLEVSIDSPTHFPLNPLENPHLRAILKVCRDCKNSFISTILTAHSLDECNKFDVLETVSIFKNYSSHICIDQQYSQLGDLLLFCKSRKIKVHTLNPMGTITQRIICDTKEQKLGIKPFFYERKGETYKNCGEYTFTTCPNCDKFI